MQQEWGAIPASSGSVRHRLLHRLSQRAIGSCVRSRLSASLVYRLAILIVTAGSLGFGSYAPVFLHTVFGSLVAGMLVRMRCDR